MCDLRTSFLSHLVFQAVSALRHWKGGFGSRGVNTVFCLDGLRMVEVIFVWKLDFGEEGHSLKGAHTD